MPVNDTWKEIVEKREKENGTKCIYIEMRRPHAGYVIFEAPQFNLTCQYKTNDFAKQLKEFIDTEVAAFVPGETVDVFVHNPGWNKK